MSLKEEGWKNQQQNKSAFAGNVNMSKFFNDE